MNKLVLWALALPLGPMASAYVFWDQPPDPNANAYIDQEFSDFPTYSSYQVHDIVVAPPGWGSWWGLRITTWYVNGPTPGDWSTVTHGRFNLFPKTGSLPGAGYDPSSGTVVPVTITNPISGVCELQTTIDLFLAPGEYWIGVTPMTTFLVHGQKFHCQTTNIVGAQSSLRNPGGSFGYGTEWFPTAWFGATADSAIRIDFVAEPTSLLLLGLMALLRRR